MSDKEIELALDRLRQARFLAGFDARQEALTLGANVEMSELSGGSREVRARALAWCARILSTGDTQARAKLLLDKSRELAPTPEASLADAFIQAATDKMGALAALAASPSAIARSAMLRIVLNADGPQAALTWMEQAGLDETSFDADGKFAYLLTALVTHHWEILFRAANSVMGAEIQENAGLLHVLAMARMLSVVPPELRSLASVQVPFEAREFPLASEAPDMKARREAQRFFAKLSDYADSVGLSEAAKLASDYALWLKLRDPVSHQTGLEELRQSMRDPEGYIRRVNFAVNLQQEKKEPESF
jgi:hypothetical protein